MSRRVRVRGRTHRIVFLFDAHRAVNFFDRRHRLIGSFHFSSQTDNLIFEDPTLGQYRLLWIHS